MSIFIGMKAIDLTGKKFGKLTVKELVGTKNGVRYWLCECECGNTKEIRRDHLTKNFIKTCGCGAHPSKSEHKSWRGFGDIPLNFYSNIKRGAESRNIKFDVSIEYLWDVYLKQGGKCALSGNLLKFGRVVKDRKTQTVSVDRIDSNLGYIEGNVQWVDKRINIMKNKLNELDFFKICKDIVIYRQL
jgi:hypothetical protein